MNMFILGFSGGVKRGAISSVAARLPSSEPDASRTISSSSFSPSLVSADEAIRAHPNSPETLEKLRLLRKEQLKIQSPEGEEMPNASLMQCACVGSLESNA